MKEFRKNNESLFVCEECGRMFTTIVSLSHHINVHYNNKQYFDKWIKDEKDENCVICGNKTNYLGWNRGYSKTCCDQCKWKKVKNTMIKIYGVDNPSKILDVQNRRIETYKSHIEEINIKRNNTYLLRFSGHMFKNEKIKEKSKKTCVKKYDVEKPNQNKEIFEKSLKSALKLKPFRDTNLWYQGTYELDFLDKYYDLFHDMQRASSIKYIFNEKNKIYHPDFYILSLNLIIEIKSTYFLEKNSESVEAKKKATIAAGFDYIMILDKDYTKFKSKIVNAHK